MRFLFGIIITFLIGVFVFPAISPIAAQSCPALPSNTGSAVLSVQIPSSGIYAIWSRMRPQGDTANAFWLKIDTACGIIVGDLNGMAANSFLWVNFRDGSSSSRITAQLSAGQHTFTLLGKEANTGVDRLLVTTDMNCTPNTLGDNCSGTTVTPTGGADVAQVGLTIGLHGIGTGGDNANPGSSGNMSPLRSQRSIGLTVFDNQNQQVADVNGTLHYNSQTGKFTGTVGMPSSVASDVYTMRVSIDGFLRKVIPGIITLTKGQTTQVPLFVLTNGDANKDNQISILDYNILLDCFSDLSPARNCADNAKKTID